MEDINNEDLTQLKTMWSELNERLSRLEAATMEDGIRVTNEKIRTAKEDLSSTYKKFSWIAFVCAIVFPITYGNPHGIISYPSLDYHIWVAIGSFLYFIMAGVMDTYLCSAVKDMNLATMSVTEVRLQAISLKRLHHIFQLILIPLAIGMLVLMMYPIVAEVWLGALLGGIIGVAIGIRWYLRMMADYKEMINS